MRTQAVIVCPLQKYATLRFDTRRTHSGSTWSYRRGLTNGPGDPHIEAAKYDNTGHYHA